MIYLGTEIFDLFYSLFYMAFLDVDGYDTTCTGSNFFEQRIDGFGAFFCTHISLEVPALTQLARYYYNSVGAGLKRFDQVRNIQLSGTGQTDYLEMIIFKLIPTLRQLLCIKAVCAVEKVYFQCFVFHNFLPEY
jgi:hypothetical protein